jgi:hypothetical protein
LTRYPTIRELGGEIYDLRRFVYTDDKAWSATNPSIGYSNKTGYVVALRSSNYVITGTGKYEVTSGDTIKCSVWFSELDSNWKCTNLRKIDTSKCGVKIVRGLEDPKLFWRNNAWHITCVVMEDHTPKARMSVARLNKECTEVTSLEVYPGIDSARPEKNWMLPHKKNPNFDFVYGPNATIKNNVLTTRLTDAPEISALRGNTNLHELEDGSYLAVTHRMFGKADTVWVPQTFGTVNMYLRNYVHYFTRYDRTGKIVEVSKGFQFVEPGVEFAAGLTTHDDSYLVSFGRKDVSSHIARLPIDLVHSALQRVNYPSDAPS